MNDKTFDKLILQVDCIHERAAATGNILDWWDTKEPLKRLNRCKSLTMDQMDKVIERNWTSVLGERRAAEVLGKLREGENAIR